MYTMRRNLTWTIGPLALTVCTVAAVWSFAGSDPNEPAQPRGDAHNVASGLVTVSVRGIDVDIAPDSVDLFVADPEAEARKAARRWGVKVCDFEDGKMVTYRGIFYSFVPGQVKLQGLTLQEGDVVYSFLMESDEQKQRLLQRANLGKPVGYSQGPEGSASAVYAGEEGYYAAVLAPSTYYTCSMHPEVVQDAPGECPKCGMELIELEIHR